MSDINSSDDDDLLRAVEALEKVVTVSDEECMEATMDLENEELGGEDDDDNQGCLMKGIRQVSPSKSKEEACHISNKKLSSGMLNKHPERNQEWKEGHDGQAGRVHGQGGAQVQGVANHHGQEDEHPVGETGAWRSPVSLPPLPSSPSTSGGSTPSSPTTPRVTATLGGRPPRVVVTLLWKRKS